MALIDIVYSDVKRFLDTNKELLFNERDFQMHLATYLRRNGPYDDVDLEYYVPVIELDGYKDIWDTELRMDVVVRRGDEYIPIELKYKTKRVTKTLPRFGESVKEEVEVMKDQGAQDLGMYDFWKDVRRIELVRKRFKKIKNGLAVFVTNDERYKKPSRLESNHANMSMTEGIHSSKKHWLKKDSKCCATHPDFDVEKDYSIHWNSTKNEGELIYYTLLTI